MVSPELTGALAGLKVLDLDDRERYRRAVEAGSQMGFGYFFPYLLTHHRTGRSAVLVTEDSGSFCVFRWEVRDSKERLDLYLPPIPSNLTVLERCLERANEFNQDYSARVVRIDAKDAEAISAIPWLVVRQRRLQYLFSPATYEDLAGRKLRTVRRNVVLIEQLPGIQVEPYSRRHATACLDLLARWSRAHAEAHGGQGGAGVTKRTIELSSELPESELRGEVILHDGALVGFAFGGEIRPGLGCSFERKCDTHLRGLTWFQFLRLFLGLKDCAIVNDGSDAGRAGLRQLKESFRPVGMHAEFRAKQRPPVRTP